MVRNYKRKVGSRPYRNYSLEVLDAAVARKNISLRITRSKKTLERDEKGKIYNREHCSRTDASTKIININSRTRKNNKPFICSNCDLGFFSQEMFESHSDKCKYVPTNQIKANSKTKQIQESPENEKERRAYRVPRQCKKCPRICMTVKELRNHQKQHTSLEPIEEHTYTHDEGLDIYICQTCSAEFQQSSEADEHVKIHEEQSYACLKCSDKFKSLRALFCHMENHPEDDKIPCPMCSFKTMKKKKLLNHLSASHLNTTICSKCGKVFNSRSNLRKHMLRHDETKKHACIVCGNVYFGEKALLRHQICMHKADIINDPSLLWCHICRVEFKTLNLLKYHINKAHTKTTNNPVEKKCLCDICGQGFKDTDNLKKHKISHTEDRPFMCFQCGKAFKHKYVLTYHQRIHTGERPYNCGYCGKSFRQWTPYKVHLRGHTGEKPYVCKICSKGFTTNQGLKLHIKNCLDSRENIGVFE